MSLQRLASAQEHPLLETLDIDLDKVEAVNRALFAESIQRQLCEERVKTFVIGDVRDGEPGVEFL